MSRMNKPIKPPRPEDAQPITSAGGSETASETANPMARKRVLKGKHVIIGAVLAAVVIGAVIWWRGASAEPKIGYSYTPATIRSVTVGVSAPAIIEARDTVNVVAPAGGRIDKLAVRSGDRIVKGQRLVLIVSDSAKQELTAAQTEWAARAADLARAEADLTEARNAVIRARSDGKAGAAQDAEARQQRAAATADEARAQLRAGDAELADARTRLMSTDVRAPFDAVVLKTDLDEDAHSVTRGAPLVTLVRDLSQVTLTAQFAETGLARIHSGERAEFTTPAFPQRKFDAKLDGLDLWPSQEAADGKRNVTYSARFAAANPGELLRPGMNASVTVITAEAPNALTVPDTALSFTPPPKIEKRFASARSSTPGHPMGRVWVLVMNQPEPRDIEIGLSDGRYTQVVAGSLRAGEKVITGALIAAGS